MTQVIPLKYWVFLKQGTRLLLTEHQLPEDVRTGVITAFNNAGYSVLEKHHLPSDGPLR